jgi:adenine/guanine phosphoribosyltransferase-like PRPP-binding protein
MGTAGLPKLHTNNLRKRHGLPLLYPELDEAGAKKDAEFTSEGISVSVEVNGVPTYGPGTELLKIYEKYGAPHCPACIELSEKMNVWGIAGCRSRIGEIAADMLPRVKIWLVQKHSWAMKMVPDAVGDPAIIIKLKIDIKKATNATEKNIKKRKISLSKNHISSGKHRQGCSGCGSRGSFTNAFRPVDTPPRFIKASQLQEDTKALIGKIPPDITAIAGVARSGMSVATMVSMYLHLPLLTIRQNSNDIQATGNGWRLGGKKHVDPKTDKILIIDDTVMTGNSLRAIKPLVQKQFGNSLSAAVYVNPAAKMKPDIWAVDLAWPHLLEWNLFNSVLSPNMATDFDGVLCQDCTIEQDDDGEKYLDFINNARPLYLSRKTPIPLIVTARIEKYRKPTEAWLKRYGIDYKKLIMHPAASLHARNQTNIPKYKAKHFKAWARSHRASPPPLAFIESDDRQAKQIAQHTGLMVISPHAGKVY